jgi:hypothetical protein
MTETEVAVIVCSRGREEALTRLLCDLERAFVPALAAGGLNTCVFAYVQGYAPAYLERLRNRFSDELASGRLALISSTRRHTCIGEVVHTAVERVHAMAVYQVAMLMDDDSVYMSDPTVDENLRLSARIFIEQRHRAYSIKLGSSRTLSFEPFIQPHGPIMPFKEKMLWVSRAVLEEVLGTPRFAELSIGEDAVIAAVAWLSAPQACFAVYGFGTFLHLGYEHSAEIAHDDLKGGYAALMNYNGPHPDLPHGKYDRALRTGVTPYHVMPDVFVGPEHPNFIYNGVRENAMAPFLARPSSFT